MLYQAFTDLTLLGLASLAVLAGLQNRKVRALVPVRIRSRRR